MSKKKTFEIIPPRINPRMGKVTDKDASVVFGNSKPDIITEMPQGNQVAHERQPKGTRTAAKKSTKRRKRYYFVPNKVTLAILEQWKERYGIRDVGAKINAAIEKIEEKH